MLKRNRIANNDSLMSNISTKPETKKNRDILVSFDFYKILKFLNCLDF